MDFEITGGNPTLQRAVRGAFGKFPEWYQRAARVSRVIITTRPDVKMQIAMYEHGTRDLYVSTEVGSLLLKAVGHELAHACDDIFDQHHFFSSNPAWVEMHRNQAYFDIDKYRDEPLEYFADCVAKVFLIGPEKLLTTIPEETRYITGFVFPTLQNAFGS